MRASLSAITTALRSPACIMRPSRAGVRQQHSNCNKKRAAEAASAATGGSLISVLNSQSELFRSPSRARTIVSRQTIANRGDSHMTLSEYTLENSPIIARPDCPECTAQMYLARIEPDKPGFDLRTFECSKCNNADQYIIEYGTNTPWALHVRERCDN